VVGKSPFKIGSSELEGEKHRRFHMTVKVSPLVHIEIVVPDVEQTYQFLHKVFGVEKVQEELVSYFNSKFPDNKCIHLELGGVVLQLVQPMSKVLFPSWYEQLEHKGPGVHNLTFFVDDLDEAVKILESEGAEIIQKFDLDWNQLYDPEKVKPDHPPVHLVDTMEKVGFRLELLEEPKL
jgi:predicted enzyme related to lactoylglutathione lyase